MAVVPATATSTSVTSSVAAGSRFGQSVQFTATVVPASGSDPTGSVSFFANGAPSRQLPRGDHRDRCHRCHTGRLEPAGRFPVDHGDLRRRRRLRLQHFARPDPGRQSRPDEPHDHALFGQPRAGSAGHRHGHCLARHRRATGTPTGTVSFTDDGSPVAGCQSLSLPDGRAAAGQLYRDLRIGRDPLHRRQLQRRRGRRREQRLIAPGGRSDPDPDDRRVVVAHLDLRPERDADGHGDPDGDGRRRIPTGTVTFYDYETNPIATVGVSTVAGTTTASLDISEPHGGPPLHHRDVQRGSDIRLQLVERTGTPQRGRGADDRSRWPVRPIRSIVGQTCRLHRHDQLLGRGRDRYRPVRRQRAHDRQRHRLGRAGHLRDRVARPWALIRSPPSTRATTTSSAARRRTP